MAKHTTLRRGIVTLTMTASLLTLGALGVHSNGAGATSAPTSIPLQRGTLKFHLSWGAVTGGSSLSGALGKFRLSGVVTQPNPSATTFVLKGRLDGFALHAVFVERVNTSAITLTAKGSVGTRALTANGVIRTSSTGAVTLTLSGKIGATKLSGTFPLFVTSITSVSGVLKVS